MRMPRRSRPRAPSRATGSGGRCRSGARPHSSTTAAFIVDSFVSTEMVSMETMYGAERGDGKMVSMKTKSALIADINDLVGAVGDKFDIEMTGRGRRRRAGLHGRAMPGAAAGAVRVAADAVDAPARRDRRRARQRGRAGGAVRSAEGDRVQARPATGRGGPGGAHADPRQPQGDGADAHRPTANWSSTPTGSCTTRWTRGVHDFLQAYGNAELQVVATVLRDLLAATQGRRADRPSLRWRERLPRRGSGR